MSKSKEATTPKAGVRKSEMFVTEFKRQGHVVSLSGGNCDLSVRGYPPGTGDTQVLQLIPKMPPETESEEG